MADQQPKADVDMVVTAAIVEILLNGGMSSEPGDFAAELGVELSKSQEQYLKDTVLRTIDQLAIPFLNDLPDEIQDRYRAKLVAHSGVGQTEVEAYAL